MIYAQKKRKKEASRRRKEEEKRGWVGGGKTERTLMTSGNTRCQPTRLRNRAQKRTSRRGWEEVPGKRKGVEEGPAAQRKKNRGSSSSRWADKFPVLALVPEAVSLHIFGYLERPQVVCGCSLVCKASRLAASRMNRWVPLATTVDLLNIRTGTKYVLSSRCIETLTITDKVCFISAPVINGCTIKKLVVCGKGAKVTVTGCILYKVIVMTGATCILHGNYVPSYHTCAILFDDGSKGVVSNNTVLCYKGTGVMATRLSAVTITNNIICQCVWGVHLHGCRYGLIANNIIMAIRQFSVFSKQSSLCMKNNAYVSPLYLDQSSIFTS